MGLIRRALLPLVLLSGIALHGILSLSPQLQQPALTPSPLLLPAGGGRGDEADSTEIAAAAPGKLLVRPTNVVTNTGPGTSSNLHFNDDGTIQLVDRLSGSSLWKFSTGPPLSRDITTANSDLSYLIYPLDGSELVEIHNGTVTTLAWELEDFITRTPYVRDSVVTIGSKASTIFAVDADSGEIIYKHSLSASLDEVGAPHVEKAPSKLDAGSIIMLIRTDYSVSASDLGVHLFNWTRTSFSANYYETPPR